MYEAEVHDTLEKLGVLEKLDFDLRITESEYRSQHELSGEIRARGKPTNEVVSNRQNPPQNLLGRLTGGKGGVSGTGEGFPGTSFYVGLNRVPPFDQDDESFREGFIESATEVEGIPENGTLEMALDWDLSEAERLRSEDNRKMVSESYSFTDFPSDLLPVRVRAELHPDAREAFEQRDIQTERGLGYFEGKAVLYIEIELKENETNDPGRLHIDTFQMEMESTFSQNRFDFPRNTTYDPEKRQLQWSNVSVWSGPEQAEDFWIAAPIDRLLSIGDVTGDLRGQIEDYTLSGTEVEGLFDQSGQPFPDRAIDFQDDIVQQVNFTASMEIDPGALRGEAQKTSSATISVSSAPQYLYERLETICDSEGIEIRERQPPGDPEPVPGRERVFTISDHPDHRNHGELKVKREYGNQGIVYADMVVTGEYTATTRETEVSAFDESEDRLVRADEGALDTRGESTVEIRARSASSELNSELIGAIEEALSGGEL
ncbi:MAG: hypothetical protein ABEH66_08545 [Halobacteriales archaeon]